MFTSENLYDVAAKELKTSMVTEVICLTFFTPQSFLFIVLCFIPSTKLTQNVYLSRCRNNFTMIVVGWSQHPLTEEYLIIIQFAVVGTLENQPCELDGNWYIALSYAMKLA